MEWWCGELTREILTGTVPYENLSEPQIIGSVGFDPTYRLELPAEVSIDPKFRGLIARCLHRDPKHRPGFEEIVRELALIREDVKAAGKLTRNGLQRPR